MSLVDAAKKIVQIAHDVLICACHKEADVIWLGAICSFFRKKRGQWKSRANIFYIRELRDLAIGVAGNIDECAIDYGTFVQSMNRHDGENLSERPVIEQTLEDRKIAEI